MFTRRVQKPARCACVARVPFISAAGRQQTDCRGRFFRCNVAGENKGEKGKNCQSRFSLPAKALPSVATAVNFFAMRRLLLCLVAAQLTPALTLAQVGHICPVKAATLLPLRRSLPAVLKEAAAAKTSLFGATALVTGTTVGAGVIALPAKTLAAGFAPSCALLVLGWLYMASTGLLIAEVNVNTLCALERDSVSINSMARETLGAGGAGVASATFAFLHYALLTAYIIQGGDLLLEAASKYLVGTVPPTTLLGPAAFALLLGLALVALPPQQLELLNNALVGGVVLCFASLLGFGLPLLQPELLLHADVSAAAAALPLMPVVYVFQTVVPTLCYLLECDLPKVRTAIIAGSGVPLLMFLAWTAVILGSVPFDAGGLAAANGEVFDPLVGLRASGGRFGDALLLFSLLAVATSFLGFTTGLVDFFADLVGWNNRGSGADGDADADGSGVAGRDGDGGGGDERLLLWQKGALVSLAVLPPVAIASFDPSVFFAALDNAGVYGILVLFGILPAAMAWEQRRQSAAAAEAAEAVEAAEAAADDDGSAEGPASSPGAAVSRASSLSPGVSSLPGLLDEYPAPEALPGGRWSLGAIIGIATAIIGLESYERILAAMGG
jgi:tyrosine-specific transport protein